MLYKAARSSAKDFMKSQLRRLSRLASSLRAADAHGFARILNKLNGGGNTLSASRPTIGELDGVPAEPRFLKHFKDRHSEDRPPPPGSTSSEAKSWIPKANDDSRSPQLDRNFSAKEVYQVIWNHKRNVAPTRCSDACAECDREHAAHRAWRTGETSVRPPQHPMLKTSRARGPDGIPAELLCWARLQDPNAEETRRKELCEDIALRLNIALQQGRMSPEALQCNTSPVPKSGDSGPNVDLYRGITVSGITAKILSLLLTRRLVHWALHHGLIDEAQVGFLPRVSAEHHVWTLYELLKSRHRHGATTCVTFVDLKKAYDKVHLNALWTILDCMGAPPLFVDLLRGLAADRSTCSVVNGASSERFPMSAGVPQGDPLSCILFVLYIEPLSRMLQRVPGVGVSPRPRGDTKGDTGLLIGRTLFADDISVLYHNPATSQIVTDVILRWCGWWGAEIGTGAGKTENVYFPPPHLPSKSPPPWLPAVLVGSATVPWVDQYKFLGFTIQSDLKHDVQLRKIKKTLATGFHDEILRSPIMQKYAPLGVQLQRLTSCSTNAANYCRAVMTFSKADTNDCDALILKLAKSLLHYPKSTSSALTWGMSRLWPNEATGARERERFLLTLIHTPTPGLASKLLCELAAERPTAATERWPSNWLHETLFRRSQLICDGAITVPPRSFEDVPTSAHVFGRTVAATILTKQLDATRSRGPQLPTLSDAGSGKHASALTLNWYQLRNPVSLGSSHGHTPVAALGPGCSGSLAALSMHNRYPATVAAALGTEALFRWPFVIGKVGAYGLRYEPKPCPCCGNPTLSLQHLVDTCTAEPLQAWRSSFDIALATNLSSTLNSAAHILSEPPPLVRSLSERDKAFTRYRFLLGMPWATASVPSDSPISLLAGDFFQRLNVPHHRLRKWVDDWLGVTEHELRELARAWLTAQGPPP